jgi:hypothetical protein
MQPSITVMKKDPYFKYLVVIVLAGLVVAVFDTAPAGADQPAKAATVVSAADPGHKAGG